MHRHFPRTNQRKHRDFQEFGSEMQAESAPPSGNCNLWPRHSSEHSEQNAAKKRKRNNHGNPVRFSCQGHGNLQKLD